MNGVIERIDELISEAEKEPRWTATQALRCLRKELLGEMDKWISVKERLPEGKTSPVTRDFEEVLCATTFGDVRAYKFGKPIGWQEPHFWHGAGLMDEYVTHWMPLPEMPSEEDANERVR